VKLTPLFEQGVTGSLMRMRSWDLYLRRTWLSSWWTYMLRNRNIHRMIHQCFFYEYQIKGKCQCWSLRKR
jgi:hypothetical protein